MKIGDKYIQDKQSELFRKMGAIWAFSKEQFEEQKQEGVEYNQIRWLGGLIVPKQHVKDLLKELAEIHAEGKRLNKTNYTKEELIEAELINYEAYYTGDIEETVEALEFYGYTYEEVLKVFNATREKNTLDF
ncbi:MAG: hypothetical protein GX025_10865 [Clostridiales bacterium]|nr:hypothetical protein [Clostridiales bacterium]